MNGKEKKRLLSALVLPIAFCPSLSPLIANQVGSHTPVLPLLNFLHSLHAKDGVYYLVSPEIVGSTTNDPHDAYIESAVVRRTLGHGYVVVYGKNEEISKRAELATEDMAIIRKTLNGSVLSSRRHGANADFSGAQLNLLSEAVYFSCHIKFINLPSSKLDIWATGDELSQKRFCVGFGMVAGMAGYRIVSREHGLDFLHVIDVKQGALITADHSHTPRLPLNQREKST